MICKVIFFRFHISCDAFQRSKIISYFLGIFGECIQLCKTYGYYSTIKRFTEFEINEIYMKMNLLKSRNKYFFINSQSFPHFSCSRYRNASCINRVPVLVAGEWSGRRGSIECWGKLCIERYLPTEFQTTPGPRIQTNTSQRHTASKY